MPNINLYIYINALMVIISMNALCNNSQKKYLHVVKGVNNMVYLKEKPFLYYCTCIQDT